MVRNGFVILLLLVGTVVRANEAIRFRVDDDGSKVSPKPSLIRVDDTDGNKQGQKPTPKFLALESREEEFKVYLGYPQQQLGPILKGQNVSATWSYGSREYNFSSISPVAGLNYRFVVTPRWAFEAEFYNYFLSIEEAVASPFIIRNSSKSYPVFGTKAIHCFIGSDNFYRQYCPYLAITSDSYPVLGFAPSSNTDLELGVVREIVIDVGVTFKYPVTDIMRTWFSGGYKHGTGAGGSGPFTPRGDSVFYIQGALTWVLAAAHDLDFTFDFSSRRATVEGQVGNNDRETWKTDTTIIGLGLNYRFNF